MDPSNRTLDSMMVVADPSQLTAFAQTQLDEVRSNKRRAVGDTEPAVFELDERDEDSQDRGAVLAAPADEPKGREIVESTCEFTSILDLRRLARKKGDSGGRDNRTCVGWLSLSDVTELMHKHAFIGVVDRQLCLSLLQHSTKLYLINHASLGWVFPDTDVIIPR